MKTLYNETAFSYNLRLMKMKSKHLLKPNYLTKKIFLSFLLLFSINIIIHAQFVQQGTKLVGTGNIGGPRQGSAVALSADGNTAIVGGPDDNSNLGAAWVYTRSGGTWTQQGDKLVGTGSIGDFVYQGTSVALSADGNTAIVGGIYDNNQIGATWIYTRSGGMWTQQGDKLVGTGNSGYVYQGVSVALSADGNTAIVGGDRDNNFIGAAWIFTRSGGTWTQQGDKLVGTGYIGYAGFVQDVSVALSADGNTAMVGGPWDNNLMGAAWVFTRSGGTWTQQGVKLVGTGNNRNAEQGISVALSADGNTAIVGGHYDNVDQGATWVFTRSGGTWTQQGDKLVGTGVSGYANQGGSVSLSADGNTALVGGPGDHNGKGAAWIFTRSGGTWTQEGDKMVGTGGIGASRQGGSVALSADGNTAMVGGWADNSDLGAAWVYVSVDTGCSAPVFIVAFNKNLRHGDTTRLKLFGNIQQGQMYNWFRGSEKIAITKYLNSIVVSEPGDYWAKIKSPDGCVIVSDTVEVRDLSGSLQPDMLSTLMNGDLQNLYAADKVLYVKLSNSGYLQNGVIRIFNSVGEAVLQQNISSEDFTMSLQSLASGVYFVKLTNGKSEINRKVLLSNSEGLNYLNSGLK